MKQEVFCKKEACNLIKKETPQQLLSREFYEVFKNTIFIEHLRWAASASPTHTIWHTFVNNKFLPANKCLWKSAPDKLFNQHNVIVKQDALKNVFIKSLARRFMVSLITSIWMMFLTKTYVLQVLTIVSIA